MNRYEILLGKKPTEEELEESFLKATTEDLKEWSKDPTAGILKVEYPRATGVTELRGQTNQMVHLDDQFPGPQDPADMTATEAAIRAEYTRAVDAIAENPSRRGGLIIDSRNRNSQGLMTEIIPARNLTHEQHRMLYAGMSRVDRETGIIITVGGQQIGQIQSWEPSPNFIEGTPENRPQPMQNLTLPSALEGLRDSTISHEYRNEYLATPVEAPETPPQPYGERYFYREPFGGRAIQWAPDINFRVSVVNQLLNNPTPIDYDQALLRTQEPFSE